MLDVVAPVDHKYVVPALEVKVTLPPVQKVVGPPAVIVGVPGSALTVTDPDTVLVTAGVQVPLTIT
jgi:hypothetical protein